MINRRSAVIEDIYADDRIPHDAYRETFVKSLAMVPIRTRDPLGAIGNYWAEHHAPTEDEVELLQALADSTAVAMENVRVYEELDQARLETLRRLALAAEYRDDATYEHTERVARSAALIAGRLGMADDEVAVIHQAAPLHDIGKLAVPDAILLKPGKLNRAEFEQMKAPRRGGRSDPRRQHISVPAPGAGDRALPSRVVERRRLLGAACAARARRSAGPELAGEIKAFFPEKRVTVADVTPDILNGPYDQALRDELRRQLAALGVELRLGGELRGLPGAPPATLAFVAVPTADGGELRVDIWFRAFGVRPHSGYLKAGPLDERGYVRVDEHLRVVGEKQVFALGDVADADRDMAGVATQQAGVVAANIPGADHRRGDAHALGHIPAAHRDPARPGGRSRLSRRGPRRRRRDRRGQGPPHAGRLLRIALRRRSRRRRLYDRGRPSAARREEDAPGGP